MTFPVDSLLYKLSSLSSTKKIIKTTNLVILIGQVFEDSFIIINKAHIRLEGV